MHVVRCRRALHSLHVQHGMRLVHTPHVMQTSRHTQGKHCMHAVLRVRDMHGTHRKTAVLGPHCLESLLAWECIRRMQSIDCMQSAACMRHLQRMRPYARHALRACCACLQRRARTVCTQVHEGREPVHRRAETLTAVAPRRGREIAPECLSAAPRGAVSAVASGPAVGCAHVPVAGMPSARP